MAKTLKKSEFIPKKSSDVKEAQKFLSLFGYPNPQDSKYEGIDMPPNPDSPPEGALKSTRVKSGEIDAATKEALLHFQKYYSLDQTGKLDKATVDMMGAKRCGMPDIGEYVAHGNKWNKNDLTYGFVNYTNDSGLTQGQIHNAIAQAFAVWAAETKLSFRRVNISSNPDIRIRFVSGDHGDGAPFDGASGVLAHAFYPPPNSGDLAGDAHFDEAENWTINIPTGSGKIDLVTVAAHEFGHALGLRHSSVNGSLMFPSYSGPLRELHSDDKNGITSIYGGYPIAHAMWTHGTSIQIERPNNLDNIVRAGFYTYLYGKANTTNWFHFAIPTPVIEEGKRLRICCAILRLRTFSDKAIVRHVHIYDGYTKIASHDNVNLTGDQWFRKYGVAHKPYVYWGLGISVGVEFKTGTLQQRRMDFVSAGCDLIK